MWTWPNLFRDQGKTFRSSDGKEICDLTVIFGNTIILFSDKRVEFNTNKPLQVAWCRWVRKAVSDSLKQLEGAERWLRVKQNRVFVDKTCTQAIPIELPDPSVIEFIRVLVTQGIEDELSTRHPEGSLSFTNRLVGSENWEPESAIPFVMGNISKRAFVHVFTDATVRLILSEFDTAQDFVAYLRQREELLSLHKSVDISKESDIVHMYYENYSDDERMRAILSAPELIPNIVSITKKPISALYNDQSFRQRKEAERASYFWDGLIESFAFHALNGTSLHRNWSQVSEIELALRVMASSDRFERRVLASALIDFYYKAMPGQRGSRVFYNPADRSIRYLFLLVPYVERYGSLENYRDLRHNMLQDYALICAGMYHDLSSLVGIAAKTRDDDSPLSDSFFGEGQDYIFLDCAQWSSEQRKASEELRRMYEENGLLTSREEFQVVAHEFPQ